MDRKCCVLLYSKYSPASKFLINYFKNLPIDFPTVVGLTMVNIDSLEIKNIIQQNGIDYVPTILIEYYNGNKQKLSNEYIYKWIRQIMETLGYNENKLPETEDPIPDVSSLGNDTPENVHQENVHQENVQENFQPKQTATEIKSKEITSMALQLQQSREEELEKLKIKNRPV